MHESSVFSQTRKKRPKPLTFLCSIIGFVDRYNYLASPNRMVAHFILLERRCVKLTQAFWLKNPGFHDLKQGHGQIATRWHESRIMISAVTTPLMPGSQIAFA